MHVCVQGRRRCCKARACICINQRVDTMHVCMRAEMATLLQNVQAAQRVLVQVCRCLCVGVWRVGICVYELVGVGLRARVRLGV